MRCSLSFFLSFIILSTTLFAKLPPALEREVKACQAGFQSLENREFSNAYKALHRKKGCPTLETLATYLYLKQDDSKASFQELTQFIQKHPSWPWIFVLEKKAERAMTEDISREDLLSWFQKHPPQTARGVMAFGEALLKTGKTTQATAFLRKAFVTTKLSEKKEHLFLSKFRGFLRAGDYTARAKRLINDGELEAAMRLLPQTRASDKEYLRTRIALRRGQDSAESLIRLVSKVLQEDPDLALDYLKWLRVKGSSKFSRTLLSLKPLVLKHPHLFWKERHIAMREMLLEGKAKEAFALGVPHGLQSGEDYFEAEWLLGWIALRHLGKPDLALRHFTRLETMVKKPQTLAKVDYWLARTYEALGHKAKAKTHLNRAAKHGTTFYGQLSAQKIGKGAPALKITPAKISPEALRGMEKHPFVRVMRLLHEAQLDDEILPFAYLLAKSGLTPDQELAAFHIAHKIAPHHGLVVEQKSTHINSMPYQESYPTLTSYEKSALACEDRALAHAVIRQESHFDPLGRSAAGACGLMQLMPKTAQLVAKKMNLRVTKNQLLTNPRLNLKLGSSYLQEQLDQYDGHKAIALAAYNAGPGNVAKWLRTIGDPRSGYDLIDWIESLPYKETRGYILHVLANYGVYKHLKF